MRTTAFHTCKVRSASLTYAGVAVAVTKNGSVSLQNTRVRLRHFVVGIRMGVTGLMNLTDAYTFFLRWCAKALLGMGSPPYS